MAPYIPAELDDYPFTPNEYRVVCRIARRGVCWEGVESMARACGMKADTVRAVLKRLEALGVIEIRRGVVWEKGTRDERRLRPFECWKPALEVSRPKGGGVLPSMGGTPPTGDHPPTGRPPLEGRAGRGGTPPEREEGVLPPSGGRINPPEKLKEPPQPPRPQPPAAPPLTLVERIERLRGSEAGALLAQGLPQEVRRKDRLGVLEQVAALYPAGLVRKALEETLPRLPSLRNPSVYLLSVVERLHAESPTPQPPSPRPRRALPAWVPPELEGHRLDEWLEAHVLARLPDAEADRAALLLKRWRADALKEPEYRMLNQLLEAGYAQRTAHAPT